MPTVREYTEEEVLKRCKTTTSQRRFKKGRRDHEIMKLAEKIKINTSNFQGKQAEGIGFTDKIKNLSKMIDYLALERSSNNRKSRKRFVRSVPR